MFLACNFCLLWFSVRVCGLMFKICRAATLLRWSFHILPEPRRTGENLPKSSKITYIMIHSRCIACSCMTIMILLSLNRLQIPARPYFKFATTSLRLLDGLDKHHTHQTGLSWLTKNEQKMLTVVIWKSSLVISHNLDGSNWTRTFLWKQRATPESQCLARQIKTLSWERTAANPAQRVRLSRIQKHTK